MNLTLSDDLSLFLSLSLSHFPPTRLIFRSVADPPSSCAPARALEGHRNGPGGWSVLLFSSSRCPSLACQKNGTRQPPSKPLGPGARDGELSHRRQGVLSPSPSSSSSLGIPGSLHAHHHGASSSLLSSSSHNLGVFLSYRTPGTVLDNVTPDGSLPQGFFFSFFFGLVFYCTLEPCNPPFLSPYKYTQK